MSPSDLLPPPRTHLLKLPKFLKLMPPTGNQVSNAWPEGGHFIFEALTRHIPLGQNIWREKASCHIHVDVFSSPWLTSWSSRGITNIRGQSFVMRIKRIEQNPKIHFLVERISGQNTWKPGIKEGRIVALQPADKAYKTAPCFLQLKSERHSLEFFPFFLLSALFWPLPLMPGIFKIFSSLSCLYFHF